MRKLMTFAITLFLCHNVAQSQTLVNREWDKSTGNPSLQYDFSFSTLDNNSNLIVVGNSVMGAQKENFLITKYDGDGNQLWQTNFDKSGNEDFATAVATFNNETYITGVANEPNNGGFNYLTMKLDVNGNIVWSQTYNGTGNADDAPTGIKVDASGNVYVTGGSTGNGTLLDFCTIKYDNNGVQQWIVRYDYNGNYDGAVGIEVEPNGTTIITGASGTSFQNWDFLTMKLDANGTVLATERTASAGNGFDKPVDIKRDNQGNIYIAGTTQLNSNDINIKLIKINANLQTQWQKTFDGAGLKDEPSKIDLDNTGNIYLTGYTEKTNGGEDFITKKYDPSGNEIWEKRRSAEQADKEAKAKSIDLDAQGNVYVAGVEEDANGDKKFLTIKYNTNGDLSFEKEYCKQQAQDAEARDIKVDASGNVYVAGKAEDTGAEKQTVVKYSIYTEEPQIEYNTNGEKYAYKDQLIAKFNPNLVDVQFINNRDAQFTTIGKLFPVSVVNTLTNKIGYDASQLIVEKVVKRLTTNETISIARDKVTQVEIPKFWSILLLHTKNGSASRSLSEVQDSLNTIPDIIFNCSKNYFLTTVSTPTDPYYQNGPNAYGDQSKGLCDPVQGINFCPLFSQAGGTSTPNWRLAIYDSGIKWDHEDLDDGSNVKGKFGHDYTNNSNPFFDPNNYSSKHGTMVAGIAGAISENGIGIAGVAGGDGTNGIGCSLYNMKVVVNNTQLIPASSLFDALVEGGMKTPSGAQGYGIDVANLSIIAPSIQNNTPEMNFLRDGLRWLYKNAVSIVCGAGNTSGTTYYPAAIFPQNFVISVAGSNHLGVLNDSLSSGNSVDVLAPSQAEQFIPLEVNANKYGNLNGDTLYEGTSFSAPLVSGTAIDLMSLHWDMTFDGQYGVYLWPDDIQYLLKKYAKASVDTFKYQRGLINAGETMKHIMFPKYEIMHRRIRALAKDTLSVQRNVNLSLLYSYEVSSSNVILPKGKYKGDVYKMGGNSVPLNIPGNKNIIGKWIGNWATELWAAPTPSGTIVPEANATIVSVNNSVGSFHGYTYFIKEDSAGNPINKWIPYNALSDTGDIYFTLHLDDTSIMGIEDENSDNSIVVYPNPASEFLNIRFKDYSLENFSFDLFDLSGKSVAMGSKSIQPISKINIPNLANGIYTLQVKVGNESSYFKIHIN